MWTLLRAIAVIACAAVAVSAARTYDITNAQFSISTFDGSSRLKVQADSAAAYNMPTQVAEADDVYRFTATITANGKLNEETLPHQAWIVVDDGESAAAVWPLRVRSTGAVSWSMRVDRMPAAVKNAIATRGPKWPFRVSLMLGSFGASAAAQPEPLELQIAELSFPPAALSRIESAPNARDVREAEEGFKPWPDHTHTFAEAPWLKMPPRAVSAAIAIAVALGPWFILVQMWRQIKTTNVIVSPRGETPFLAALGALEALAVLYWVGYSPFFIFPTAGVALLVLLRGAHDRLS